MCARICAHTHTITHLICSATRPKVTATHVNTLQHAATHCNILDRLSGFTPRYIYVHTYVYIYAYAYVHTHAQPYTFHMLSD